MRKSRQTAKKRNYIQMNNYQGDSKLLIRNMQSRRQCSDLELSIPNSGEQERHLLRNKS